MPQGRNLFRVSTYEAKSAAAQGNCVFVSHRLSDILVAKTVARYLTETVGVNVYFSDDDEALKKADREGWHTEVVRFIERAIDISSHIIGVISNRTKGSWWVPFEFGAARQQKLKTAQLLLEEVKELPAYLKIATLLRSQYQLRSWVNSHVLAETEWARSYKAKELPDIPKVADYSSSKELLFR